MYIGASIANSRYALAQSQNRRLFIFPWFNALHLEELLVAKKNQNRMILNFLDFFDRNKIDCYLKLLTKFHAITNHSGQSRFCRRQANKFSTFKLFWPLRLKKKTRTWVCDLVHSLIFCFRTLKPSRSVKT
jgi:hypothetical protein